MLEGRNDAERDLDALADFCGGLDATVMLLRFNVVEGLPFRPTAFGKMALWSMELAQRGIQAAVDAVARDRRRRGLRAALEPVST